MNKMVVSLLLGLLLGFSPILLSVEKFVLDNFEAPTNALYTKSGMYKKPDSDVKKSRTKKEHASGESALFIAYKKEVKGFCGYFIQTIVGNKFFDASKYSKLTFMVKGKKGGENFQVGLADEKWFKLDDSVKSEDIGKYLPAGKITTEWQKAEIPLKFFVDKQSGDFDLTKLGAVSICFESSCFPPDGVGKGIIYIDDVSFE